MTVATQNENGEKSLASVFYIIAYMEGPKKERPAIKGKANHEKKNCTRSQSLCVPRADTVSNECHVEILTLISKNLLRVQMSTETLYYLHIYINADYKKHDFSRLRLYCTPASTHLQCQRTFATYYQQILIKSQGLSVVSDPDNVLMYKQGRLTM